MLSYQMTTTDISLSKVAYLLKWPKYRFEINLSNCKAGA